MLQSSHRLSVRQFNVVLEKGRSAHSRFFLVRYTFGNPDTRISAVVPKKVGKTAVARNAGRRMIYNAVRPIYPKLISGAHIIIFSKLPLKKPEIAVLPAEMSGLFVKTGLLV